MIEAERTKRSNQQIVVAAATPKPARNGGKGAMAVNMAQVIAPKDVIILTSGAQLQTSTSHGFHNPARKPIIKGLFYAGTESLYHTDGWHVITLSALNAERKILLVSVGNTGPIAIGVYA